MKDLWESEHERVEVILQRALFFFRCDASVTLLVLHCARKQKTEADRPRKTEIKRR